MCDREISSAHGEGQGGTAYCLTRRATLGPGESDSACFFWGLGYEEVAAATGAKPATIAIAWLLRKRGVTAPIASATSLSQLQSLVAAATLSLSAEALALLDKAGA